MTREDREDAIDIIQSILDKYEEDECLVTEITIGDEDIKAFKMAIKALEQEPSSSGFPNKSEIPTGSDDCISRKQALDLLCKKCPVYDCNRKCISYKAIEKMPPSTPIRPKGHWIDHSDEGYVECPKCGSATNCDDNINDLHFCFSCGAEMDGVKNEKYI